MPHRTMIILFNMPHLNYYVAKRAHWYLFFLFANDADTIPPIGFYFRVRTKTIRIISTKPGSMKQVTVQSVAMIQFVVFLT